MMTLDALTTEVFVPYRDEQDRPRLLDVTPQNRPSASAAPLYRKVRKILAAGRKVDTELEYREWLTTQWEPLDQEILKANLGRCINDEGRLLMDMMDAVMSAVWRPGWRAE